MSLPQSRYIYPNVFSVVVNYSTIKNFYFLLKHQSLQHYENTTRATLNDLKLPMKYFNLNF
jgi:hypothetical protein